MQQNGFAVAAAGVMARPRRLFATAALPLAIGAARATVGVVTALILTEALLVCAASAPSHPAGGLALPTSQREWSLPDPGVQAGASLLDTPRGLLVAYNTYGDPSGVGICQQAQGAWSCVHPLVPAGLRLGDPQLLADSGSLYLAGTLYRYGSGTAVAAVRPALFSYRAGHWALLAQPGGAGDPAGWVLGDQPSLTADGQGALLMAWSIYRPGFAAPAAAVSVDGGRTFRRLALPATVRTRLGEAVALAPGLFLVAAQDVAAHRIVVWRLDARGLVRPAVREVASYGAVRSPLPGLRFRITDTPTLARDARGTLAVAWDATAHGHVWAYLARSRDGGHTWSAPWRLAPAGATNTMQPVVRALPGSGFAVLAYAITAANRAYRPFLSVAGSGRNVTRWVSAAGYVLTGRDGPSYLGDYPGFEAGPHGLGFAWTALAVPSSQYTRIAVRAIGPLAGDLRQVGSN